MNNFFKFKKFTVFQDRCAMKVGTDAVLLGAWCNLSHSERILDVGTGSGILALMCAQRSHTSAIDAIEIDAEASSQAADNFRKSTWGDRLQVIHDSLQNYLKYVPYGYDGIVSNPPYFRSSLKPSEALRSAARHDDRLTLEALLHCSRQLLKKSGNISVVYPAKDIEYLKATAFLNDFHPVRITMVRPVEGKTYNRCLVELSFVAGKTCTSEEITIKTADNIFTESYKELTKDFYLNF